MLYIGLQTAYYIENQDSESRVSKEIKHMHIQYSISMQYSIYSLNYEKLKKWIINP